MKSGKLAYVSPKLTCQIYIRGDDLISEVEVVAKESIPWHKRQICSNYLYQDNTCIAYAPAASRCLSPPPSRQILLLLLLPRMMPQWDQLDYKVHNFPVRNINAYAIPLTSTHLNFRTPMSTIHEIQVLIQWSKPPIVHHIIGLTQQYNLPSRKRNRRIHLIL